MTEAAPPRNAQLSLQGMMIGVAIASCFLGIASYLGFDNGFLIVCAVASGLLSFVFTFTIPRGKFGRAFSAVAVAGFLLCNPLIMFFSVVMAVNCIGHWILIARFKRLHKEKPANKRQVLFSSIVVTLLAFSVGVAIGLPGYLEFKEEIKKYEPVEIASKLPYESDFETEAPKDLIPQNTLAAEYNYSELESNASRFFGRNWALEGIHERRTEQFVKSPGFGVARMFVPTIDRIRLPEIQNVGFDEVIEPDHRQFHRFTYSDSVDPDKMHETTVFDFVHPDGIGVKVEPDKFSGFTPHAFYRSPIGLDDPIGNGTLKLESLQLVSLRRFDSPRVYELDYLPRMDELSSENVPTRDLTTFEVEAIEKLKVRTAKLLKDESDTSIRDIVFSNNDDGIEMVGALRAINSCLQCHRAKRHEMLGAFTYRFSTQN